MTQRIIFLTGYKQSGKDTIAAHLVDQHGFTRLAFADPLRNLLWHLNPIVELAPQNDPWGMPDTHLVKLIGSNTIEGWEFLKSNHPETYRALLRNIGAAVATQDTEFSVRWIRNHIDGDTADYVITDTRFPGEYDLYARLRAFTTGPRVALWHVTREAATSDGHPSESLEGMPKPQVTIKNDGSLAYLHGVIDGLLQS